MLVLAQREIELAESSPDLETLLKQVVDWSAQLEQNLGIESNHSREDQKKFNRFFSKSFRSGNDPFIGFVFIQYSAMESPKIAINQDEKQDSVVFEVIGSKEKIITNLASGWPPLPPDSPWLIVGERMAGEIRLLDRNQKKETLQQSKVHFVFQSN